MLPVYFSVDVVMDRVALDNRWVSEQWQPAAVVPLGRGTRVAAAGRAHRRLARAHVVAISTDADRAARPEAEGYFLNLTSTTPVVFVMWRAQEDGAQPAAQPLIVTVSYNEAGRFMDGGERVDPVPMPEPIRAWLAAFVAVHYKPEPKKKQKRNDPFKEGAFVREPPPSKHE